MHHPLPACAIPAPSWFGHPLQWWAWATPTWRPSAPLCAAPCRAPCASWQTACSPRAAWCRVRRAAPRCACCACCAPAWVRPRCGCPRPALHVMAPEQHAHVPRLPIPCLSSPPCLLLPAGHKDALEEVQRQATAKGALKAVPVAVSGAFHTSLMQPARDALTEASQLLPAALQRSPAGAAAAPQAHWWFHWLLTTWRSHPGPPCPSACPR